jgi:hypothetical protein
VLLGRREVEFRAAELDFRTTQHPWPTILARRGNVPSGEPERAASRLLDSGILRPPTLRSPGQRGAITARLEQHGVGIGLALDIPEPPLKVGSGRQSAPPLFRP